MIFLTLLIEDIHTCVACANLSFIHIKSVEVENLVYDGPPFYFSQILCGFCSEFASMYHVEMHLIKDILRGFDIIFFKTKCETFQIHLKSLSACHMANTGQ